MITAIANTAVFQNKNNQSSDVEAKKFGKEALMFIITIWVIELILLALAISTAFHCNAPGDRALSVIVAILFPELYLMYVLISKYALKTPGFCGNAMIGGATESGSVTFF
jgi:hypothetical protein